MANPLGQNPDTWPDDSSYLDNAAALDSQQSTGDYLASNPIGGDNYASQVQTDSDLSGGTQSVGDISGQQGSLLGGGQDSGSNTDGILFALNPANWSAIFDNISATNTGEYAGGVLGNLGSGVIQGASQSIASQLNIDISSAKQIVYLMLAAMAVESAVLIYILLRK